MEGVLVVKSRVESDQKKGRMPDVAVSQSCLYRVLLGAGALHFEGTAQQALKGGKPEQVKRTWSANRVRQVCVCRDDMTRTEFKKLVGSSDLRGKVNYRC